MAAAVRRWGGRRRSDAALAGWRRRHLVCGGGRGGEGKKKEKERKRKGKGRHTPLLPGPGEMASRRSTDEMRERVVLGEFGVRNVRGAGQGRAG